MPQFAIASPGSPAACRRRARITPPCVTTSTGSPGWRAAISGVASPLRELLPRLAVVADLSLEPSGVTLRESLLDLCPGQARPRADVDLAERRILDDGEPEPSATARAVSRARARSLE